MPTKKLRALVPVEAADLAAAGYDVSPGDGDARRSITPAVCGAVRRYAALVTVAAAELDKLLSRAEWNAIADANKGCADVFDYDSGSGPQLAPLMLLRANVEDSLGLGKKWKVDQEKLATKMRSLTPAHGEAILAAVRFFWAHSDDVDPAEDDWWLPKWRQQSVVKSD